MDSAVLDDDVNLKESTNFNEVRDKFSKKGRNTRACNS